MNKNLLRTLVAILVIDFLFQNPCLAQNNKDYGTMEMVPLVFELPRSRNGLKVNAFQAKISWRIERWQKSSKLIFNIRSVQSTPSNPSPSFEHSYYYNGVQYGNQHVGYEVFNGIKCTDISYDVIVQGPGVNWHSVVDGLDNQISNLPLNAAGTDYSFHVKIQNVAFFQGTNAIETAIRKLIDQNKNKENYDKYVKAGDNYFNQKSWSSAINNYKSALALFPNETYPSSQLQKIESLQQQETANKNKMVSNSTNNDNNNARTIEQTANNTKRTTESNTTDDFWQTGKKNTSGTNTNTVNRNTSTNTNNSNGGIDRSKLPEFFRTTDGGYFHKVGDKVQEISQDEYNALKKQRADQKITQQNTKQQLSPAEQQKAVDDIMNKIKADQEKDQKMWDDFNKKSELRAQAYAVQGQINDAKEALNENSTLQGSYQSVDQLMADFNQKMASINSMTSDLESKRNAQMNLAVDANFSEPEMQAYGQGMKLIGSIVNSAKEAKERKEAQARLRAQKEAAIANMKAEEARLLTGLRTDLFKRFKEGALPLSSTKLDAQTIYYFAYAYNPAELGNKQTTLFISNVFPIDRYGDGTWPFKNNIVNELSKLTPYTEIMHGYYLSKEEAESMRQGMMNIFVQSGGSTRAFVYKGKTSSSSKSGSTDFWETGKKATDSLQKKDVKKKDDFWNN